MKRIVINMIYPKITFAILLMFYLSSTASAFIDDATVQYYVSIHNSMIDKAPQFIKDITGNETIDFNITRNDGSIYRTGLEMKNAHVSKIDKGGISNPTVSINATEDAVNRIIRSTDPLVTFMQELNSGGLAIQMHNLHDKGKGCPFLGLQFF